jgi:hypothetical protein
MKHHCIVLVVDFQLTIKPFSLSWCFYRIPPVCSAFLTSFYGTDGMKFPTEAERRLSLSSSSPSYNGLGLRGTAGFTHRGEVSFDSLQHATLLFCKSRCWNPGRSSFP